MEDSENGGKGEMQERNRNVVYLPLEKVEREILSFLVFRSKSNRCILNFKCRDLVPIYICHLSQPALSTRYCHFAPTWNRPVPRPPRLKIT
jgi:hypothetical protein